jgi:hypothetical protein
MRNEGRRTACAGQVGTNQNHKRRESRVSSLESGQSNHTIVCGSGERSMCGSETLLSTLKIQWNINQRKVPSLKQTLHHCQAGCLKDRNIVSVRKFMELSLICVFFEKFFRVARFIIVGVFIHKIKMNAVRVHTFQYLV